MVTFKAATLRILVLCVATPVCFSKAYWDSLPVGIHGGVRNRPSSDVGSLAKFRVVVIDPAEGPQCTTPCHACCNVSAAACAVEDNIVRTLKSVKDMDSSVITMAYINSILMMPYFTLSKRMYANASKLLLRDSTDKIMSFAGDGGTGFFCGNFPTYDLTQEAAGAAILADFAAMNSSGAVDGVYLDKSGTWPGNGDTPVYPQGNDTLCQHECYSMTPSQTAAYISGRLDLFRAFDQACSASGGICSIDARVVQPPVAPMLHGYMPRSIHIFRAAVKKSYTNATIEFVRDLEGKTEHLLWYGTCQTETEVAFFLVMAWPGCYCMSFSNDDTAEQLWEAGWHYNTPLGLPKGPAQFVNSKTWVRTFATGAEARYDLVTGNGKVIWPSGNTSLKTTNTDSVRAEGRSNKPF
eukprot:m.125907 g.125907  ORF g.125907 m.125907 type:complete len:409 (+) comp29165_c0_seq1:181-1407(+)